MDFSPSSIRDRWAAGRRDMETGLPLLPPPPAPGSRFDYLSIKPEDAGAAAAADGEMPAGDSSAERDVTARFGTAFRLADPGHDVKIDERVERGCPEGLGG